nr:hypothetical protein [Tanacetum cinerariifolium]
QTTTGKESSNPFMAGSLPKTIMYSFLHKIYFHQVLDKYSALVHRVAGLESANTAQQLKILNLKARVKKLERLNKGKKSVDIDEGIELLDDQEKDAQVIPAAAEPVVVAVSIPISAAKPKGLKAVPAAPTVLTGKRKGVVIRDPEEKLHDDTPAETHGVASAMVVVLTAVVSVVAARGVVEKRRVRESGVEGRIDRVIWSIFGFAGKIPPEKFSGGGRRRRVVAGRLWLPPVVGSGERNKKSVCINLDRNEKK